MAILYANTLDEQRGEASAGLQHEECNEKNEFIGLMTVVLSGQNLSNRSCKSGQKDML